MFYSCLHYATYCDIHDSMRTVYCWVKIPQWCGERNEKIIHAVSLQGDWQHKEFHSPHHVPTPRFLFNRMDVTAWVFVPCWTKWTAWSAMTFKEACSCVYIFSASLKVSKRPKAYVWMNCKKKNILRDIMTCRSCRRLLLWLRVMEMVICVT